MAVDMSYLDEYFNTAEERPPFKEFAKRYCARPACRCPGCGMKYDHKPLTGLCYNGCKKLTMQEVTKK